MADPVTLVDRASEEVLQLVLRGVDLAELRVERFTAEIAQLSGHLRGLSPQSTLERGYAIARRPDGSVVSRTDQVSSKDELSVVVSDGVIHTRVD
jgi:exodeoxyribonuclease VII large subunit